MAGQIWTRGVVRRLLSGRLPCPPRRSVRGRASRVFVGWTWGSFLLTPLAISQSPAGSVHPLDALTRDEIAVAVATLRAGGKLGAQARFGTLHLHEPPKAQVLDDLRGGTVRRSAFALVYNWETGTASEAVVDLGTKKLASWRDLVPGDPPVRLVIINRLDEIARRDPRFRAATARRGVTDLSRIAVLAELQEGTPLARRRGDRLVQGFVFFRDSAPPNDFLPGLRIFANLTKGKIDSISDRGSSSAGATRAVPSPRQAQPDSKQLESSREVGRAFIVTGSEVRWGNWRLHYGVHPRRGLELYDIGYKDGDRYRTILYRASVSEMLAPYGDPAFAGGTWYPRDEGDYGLGVYGRTSAVEGADAPADAVFAGAVLADDHGAAFEIPRAVAIYEQDGGVLWRHASNARRARELVLTGYATIDNYDYVFNWIFGQDGALEVQVQLTGIMNIRRTDQVRDSLADHGDHAAFGHLVAPGINAPNHQHFFSYRLDFDIDGADSNSVIEMNTESLPTGRQNPGGEWFPMSQRALRTEREGQRELSLESARCWKIATSKASNALGQPSGYTLMPGTNTVPFASPSSKARLRAGFVNHHLWVTPYRPDEMYASGEWVNSGRVGEGLPQWTSANRSIDNQDVVLWYTLGVTHVPRTEDWPIMPVHSAGFRIVPAGFFSHNPALDVPPDPHGH